MQTTEIAIWCRTTAVVCRYASHQVFQTCLKEHLHNNICLNQTRNRIYILCLCERNVWYVCTVSNKAALNTFQRHSAKHACTCGLKKKLSKSRTPNIFKSGEIEQVTMDVFKCCCICQVFYIQNT